MFSRFFAAFSTALCTLYFTLPHVQSLAASVFDDFNGERICKDPNTPYTPAIYCQEMDEQSTADCSSLNLQMTKENGRYDLYSREIVACRVQNEIVGCISGARSDEYYIIWSYYYPEPTTRDRFERCFGPQEIKIQGASTQVAGTQGASSSTKTEGDGDEDDDEE